MTDNLQEL